MIRFRRFAALVLAASFVSAAPALAQTAPTVTGTALSPTDISWSWTATAGATGYRILSSTNPGANISGDLPAAANTFALTGFSTNTLGAVMVEAFGAGFTVDAATSAVRTLAARPTGTMLLGTLLNQVTLSWQDNGNVNAPAGITYVVNWTSGTGIGVLFSTTPAVIAGTATATINDLPGGQFESFSVEALNSSGVASGFDVTVTTTIPAIGNQPSISTATFSLGVSSIAWFWSASPGALAYQLFSSSNGAISPILPSTTLTFTQTGLSTNTAYTNFVYAYSVPASTSSTPFTQFTLAAPTTGLTLISQSAPPASGVSSPSELISWGANGNPPGTNYNILWWTNLTSTVTASTGTTTALVGNLYAGSTLYFTVQAVNFAGSTAAFDSTFFLPGFGQPPFAVNQSTFFAVGSQVLPVGFSGILTFVVPNGAGTGAGAVVVQIASGTFTSAVTLAVSTPAANQAFPAVGGAVSDLPNPIHLTISALDAFGAPQQPVKPVLISVDYAAANFSANQTTLSIARFDTNRQAWIPLATSKHSSSLWATTDHFSSFAVLSVAAAADLASITVGPNPLRTTENPGTVMTFRNLPAGCRVRIFTYVGEKVVDLIADGGGVAAWNGRNHVGSLVASGVYIALIEGAGTKKTMRVAIER